MAKAESTEWLPTIGLSLIGGQPPEPGSVVIDLTDAGPNPKIGVVAEVPNGRAIIQVNEWWEGTKPLHVHPWHSDGDAELLLTGLTARLETSAEQTDEDAKQGHGLLTVGTDGVRLHCLNILARNAVGGLLVFDPRTWKLGGGTHLARYATRRWRIVADTPTGLLTLCEGSGLATPAKS